jgi:nucleoside-diphosphate-sugar epimerase
LWANFTVFTKRLSGGGHSRRSPGQPGKLKKNAGHIVVTGGAGYIGSHLVRSLTALGYHVIVIDNGSHAAHTLRKLLDTKCCHLIAADIRNETATRSAYLGAHSVFHLAAITGPAAGDKMASLTNVLGTEIVASLAAKSDVRKFFFASTCSVYGSNSDIVDETFPSTPLDHYAETKIQAETVLNQFAHEMSVCAFRFGTAFGLSPKMKYELVVNAMTWDAVVKGIITVKAPLSWRPFIHCKDVASACVEALRRDLPPATVHVFNVGSNENNMTILSAARLVNSLVRPSRIELVNVRPNQPSYRVNFSKIRSLCRWSPNFSLNAGITEVRDKGINSHAPHYAPN